MLPSKFFNNSGPVNSRDHFCVPPIRRLDARKIWQLILQKKYFLIRGPKQCGKTSFLLSLAEMINRDGKVKCLYMNVESLRGVQEDVSECIRSILFEISSRARDTFDDEYLEDLVPEILSKRGPYQAFNEFLTQWSKRSDRPIVLFIDEIDTLDSTVLTPILSQIRAGYDKRPAYFPQSIVFCATHDVIDKQFNIKDATLQIGFFHREEVNAMFTSYAEDNGLKLTHDALDRVWYYTSGQPWIVSSLAEEIFSVIVPAKKITRIMSRPVDEAFQNLLARQGNHLEFLTTKLRDERVKRALMPILTGGLLADQVSDIDLNYTRELGILSQSRNNFDNMLYTEVLPRALYAPVTYMINLSTERFLLPDQSIDTIKLIKSFQLFFRNHIDRLVERIDYGPAAYTLVFQALLQKLEDGTCTVTRDFSAERGFTHISINWRYPRDQAASFLVKLVRIQSLERYKQMVPGLAETCDNWKTASLEVPEIGPVSPEEASPPPEIEACDADVHVIAININPKFQWEDKLPCDKKNVNGKTVHVWGF